MCIIMIIIMMMRITFGNVHILIIFYVDLLVESLWLAHNCLLLLFLFFLETTYRQNYKLLLIVLWYIYISSE